MNDHEGNEGNSGIVSQEELERANERFGVIDEQQVKVNGTVRKRCQQVKRDGAQCRGFVVDTERQLCRVHAVEDGRYFGGMTPAESQQKSAETVRTRLELRRAFAGTARLGPRAALKAMAAVNAHALASTAIDGALSNEVPKGERARLALQIVRETDPPGETSVEVSLLNTTIEDLPKLSMSELRRLAALLEARDGTASEAKREINEASEGEIVEGEASEQAESGEA